jgi:AraC-like DNA-binding protein
VDPRLVTVSSRVLATAVHAAEAMGVATAPVLEQLAIDRRSLDDVDGRVPLVLEEALWDALAERAGDPCFGLAASAHARPEAFDVIGHALRACVTLDDLLRVASRFNRLTHDVAELRIATARDETRVAHGFRGSARGASRHAIDFTFGTLVRVARSLTRVDVRPLRVAFRHSAPASTSPYRALFQCEVQFRADEDAFTLRHSDLSLPIASADGGLRDVLLRHAEVLLARLPPIDDETVMRTRTLLAAELRGGDPSLEAIAKKMHMSARTLQRRLDDAGTSHQALLDALRSEMAISYLADERIGISEVAFMLGYSEPSAFQRAFKRWTGTTPGHHRARA